MGVNHHATHVRPTKDSSSRVNIARGSGKYSCWLLPGVLLLLGGILLPQAASAHPCQYMPEYCPTPSTPPPPSASENPSLDGSYYVTAPPPSGYYFGLVSGAGQYDQSRIDVSGQTTGQYKYYAEYCLDAGSYNKCGNSSATTVTVVRTPGTPSIGNLSAASLCQSGWTVSWSTGGSIPTGAERNYHLQQSINGGSWSTVSSSLTVPYKSLSIDESKSYRYRVSSRDKYNGYYSSWTGYDYTNTVTTLTCTPGKPGAPSVAHTGTTAVVTWSAPSTGKVENYRLQRRGRLKGESTWSGWVTISDDNVLTYTDAESGALPLVRGYEYQYQVRAENDESIGDQVSGWSNASVAVYVAHARPTPPGGILFSSAADAPGNYTMQWGPSSGDVAYYQVQESINGGTWTDVDWEQYCSGTGCTFSGKTLSTSYAYRVRACNSDVGGALTADEGCSPYTGAKTIRFPAVPGTPTITAIDPAQYGRIYTVQWTVSPDSGVFHELRWREAGGSSWLLLNNDGLDTSERITGGVTEGKSYQYKARACYSITLCGPYSGVVEYWVPSQPTITVSVNNLQPMLSVSLPSGAAGYRLEERIDSGGWTNVSSAIQNGAYSPATVNRGSTYHYWAKACNAQNACSAYGNLTTNYIPHLTPGVVQNLQASLDASGAPQAIWTAPAGGGVVKDYRAEFSTDGGQNWSPTPPATVTGSPFKPANPVGGLSYRFRITACNPDGVCGDAAVSGAVALSPPQPNIAITDVEGDPINDAGHNGVYTLKWSSAGGAVTKIIAEELISGSWVEITEPDTANPAALAYAKEYNQPPNYSNPKVDYYYEYRAQACNGANCSAWKTITVAVRPYPIPHLPADFYVSQGPDNAGAYTLAWLTPPNTPPNLEATHEDAEIVHFYYLIGPTGDVTADGMPVGTEGVDYWQITHDNRNTPYTQAFSGGVSGESYTYRIAACFDNYEGCTHYQPLAVRIPYAAPGKPGPLSHTPFDANGDYTLQWGPASGEVDEYEVQQLSNGDWTDLASVTVLQLPVGAQPRGEERAYRVRACNTDECGDYTDPYGVRRPYQAPDTPADFRRTGWHAEQGSLTLSWSVPFGEVDRYVIEQLDDNSAWLPAAETANPTLTLTGLLNGRTHQFRLRACNVDACSDNASLATDLPYAAPGTPGPLSHIAAENNPAAGEFTVHWTAPAAIDAAVAPVARYEVEYSALGGLIQGRVEVSVTSPAAGSPASATLTGLDAGDAYRVRARACNANACSDYTAAYQVYLPYPAPAAPAFLLTVPGADDHAARRFTVQWTPPASGRVSHYDLEASTGVIQEVENWVSVIQKTQVTAYTFVDRRYGESYRYRVRACSEPQSTAGTCSPWAITEPPVRLKYPTPATPGGIVVNNLDHTAGSYSLTWNGVLGWAPRYRYQLQQAPAGTPADSDAWTAPAGATGEWAQLDQTGYAITGQLPGHYAYRVRACNPDPDNDCGGWSQAVEATVLATPNSPASLNVDAGTCRFQVNWTPPTGTITGEYRYELAYRMDSGAWQSLAWSSGTSHDMIVDEDSDQVAYTFQVRARILSHGEYSPWSNWRTAATVPAMSCGNTGDSSGGVSVTAPSYSETGRYDVTMRVNNTGGIASRSEWVSANGGQLEMLDGIWAEEDHSEVFLARFDHTNPQPTSRYTYRIQVCYADGPVPDVGACDPFVVAEADTIVLRDPGSVGPLTAGESARLVEGVYRLPDRQFTLNWSAAPNPGLAGQYYEVQFRQTDADELAPGDTTGAWMILSQQTGTGFSGSLPESGIPYDYRVRACVSFADYVNCGAWANLAAPLIQAVGAPRFAGDIYPEDRELVIHDRRVPLQWLPPLGMAAAGALDHYQISLRSQEVGDDSETFWVGPETLTTVAPETDASGEPLLQQASVDVVKSGRKEFLIRACGSPAPESCGDALTFEITVIVPPEPPAEPGSPAALPDPDGSAGSPFNGALAGEFTVLPSGAAGYTLPIAVPPGTASMQPEISLTYNSQAGNGIAGQGWSVGGLSAIGRCNMTLAQDGEVHGVIEYGFFGAYCLDGQRLIEIGSNQYRTEINNFSRITKMSGGVCGAWFKVETQDGRVLEYGNSEDACINAVKADGSYTVTHAWALNKVTDVSGNYMVYKYLEDTAADGNAYAIDRIEYSGHANHAPYTAVEFEYEERPDASSGYHAGVKFTQARRLTAITTGVSAANPAGYGAYTLTYAPEDPDVTSSRLQAIDYCATDAGGEQCMAPLAFEWSEPEAGWASLPAAYAPPIAFVDGEADLGARLIDLDNDGLPDLLYASQNHQRIAYRNTGSRWEYWPAFKPLVDFVNDEYKDLGVRFADINGDGYTDMLTSIYDTYNYRAYLNNSGQGWTELLNALPTKFQNGYGDDYGARMVDLNGDARVDIVLGRPPGFDEIVSGLTGIYASWRNSGSNSDRWQDWATDGYSNYTPSYKFIEKRGPTTRWNPIDAPDGYEDKAWEATAWLADLNGDGLVDVLTKDTPHAHAGGTLETIQYRARINSGHGWISDSDFDVSGQFDYYQLPDAGTLLADFNGDGLPDLMRGNTDNDLIKLNTGDGWVDAPFAKTPRLLSLVDIDPLSNDDLYLTPVGSGVQLADVNGDGRTDVLVGREAWLATEPSMSSAFWDEDARYAMPVALGEGLLGSARVLARAQGVQLADINGDGRLDLLHGVGAKKSAWTTRIDRRQLIAVSDGLGNTTEIQYQALTDKHENSRGWSLYTRTGRELDQPREREANIPMQVVSLVTVNDGIGGELMTEYVYKGLTTTTDGRGLQGFEQITAYKPGGTVAVTRYKQRFPYTGLPVEVKVTYGEGLTAPVIERTSYEYCYAVTSEATAGSASNPETPGFTSDNGSCGEYDDPARHNESVFVFPILTTTVRNRLSNDLRTVTATVTTVTDKTYGAFGYPTRTLATTTGDGNTYTTEIEYDYNTGLADGVWRGRVHETVTTRRFNGGDDGNNTRTTRFEYYPGSGLPKKEIVEPGAGAPLELHTAYQYDAYGNATQTTVCASDFGYCEPGAVNPNAAATDSEPFRTTTTVYDPQGRYPESVTNSENHRETYAYEHPLGLKTYHRGPNGLETFWVYDALGRKERETAPFGTTTWDYSKADSGYTPGAKYRVQENPTAGAPARVYYDGLGRKLRALTQNLHGEWVATDTRYDRFGRIERVSEPYLVYSTLQSEAYWTETDYDALGRVTEVRVPLGDLDGDGADDGVATTTTDYQGFETLVTDPKGRVKLTQTNAIDQTVRVVDDVNGLNIAVDYTYDSQGNLKTTTTDNNPATTVTIKHDKRGNKEYMIDPDMGRWDYRYNGYGELIWQQDAKGNITEIDYDSLGRMLERRETPAGGSVQTSTWEYDEAPGAGIGKLHVETGPQGDVKTYTYTSRGQLENTGYAFNVHGWSQTFNVTRSYDAFGRTQLIYYPQVGDQRKVVEHRYSPHGGLWYVIDAGDPLDSGDNSVYWIAELVDARGRLLQETLRNRNTVNHATNAATGWLLKTESWDKDLNMIQQTRYEFDAVGNLEIRERFRPWIVMPDGNGYLADTEEVIESFTYDSLDRLRTETLTRDGMQESFKQNGYDNLGNLTYKGEDTPEKRYAYNACNAGPHAVCSANGASFTYDANGNLIASTAGTDVHARTIEYSAFNKPTRITENGVSVEFVYGADRSRVFKRATTADGATKITWYVGLGGDGQPIYEQTATLDAGGQIVKREHLHFVYAGGHHKGQPFAVHVLDETEDNNASTPNLIWDGGTEYYHRDHLGSVIAITGDSGEAKDTRFLSFDAWGKRRHESWREDSPNPDDPPVDQYTLEGMQGNLAYTGHEAVPEVGLIHMNGRVYDPELGRFFSADPHVQDPKGSQSYNRYSYVHNNPLRYTDPSGYFLDNISPTFATVINIALYYVPGCQSGACSAAFSAAWAKANGASTSQAILSAGASFVGGGIGQGAGAAFINPYVQVFVQGAVSGAITGGFNATLTGESFFRGALKGAVSGAATAMVMTGIRKAIGALQPETTEDTVEANGAVVNDAATRRSLRTDGTRHAENAEKAEKIITEFFEENPDQLPGDLEKPLDFKYVHKDGNGTYGRQVMHHNKETGEITNSGEIVELYAGSSNYESTAMKSILHEYGHNLPEALAFPIDEWNLPPQEALIDEWGLDMKRKIDDWYDQKYD